MNFLKSQTCQNLMRAFAGECMARTRYDQAAQACSEQNLAVLSRLFDFTARQEHEHAQQLYLRLSPAAGQPLSLNGADYPIDDGNISALLAAAVQNERNEQQTIYPAFGAVAEQEGFPDVARLFTNLAAIEQSHGDRFSYYAGLLDQGQLFHSDTPVLWLCLNCGHILTAADAPLRCPVCQHDQGYFVRAETQIY